jgi:hypothetical protein
MKPPDAGPPVTAAPSADTAHPPAASEEAPPPAVGDAPPPGPLPPPPLRPIAQPAPARVPRAPGRSLAGRERAEGRAAAPVAATDPEPTVAVTIGRIDVHAAPPPAPMRLAPPAPARPAETLEDYLRERDRSVLP